MLVLLVIPVNICWRMGVSPLWGLAAPFVLGPIPWLHRYWFPYGYGPGQRKHEQQEPV